MGEALRAWAHWADDRGGWRSTAVGEWTGRAHGRRWQAWRMAGLGEALASATLSSLLDFGLDGGAMTAARSAVGEAVTPRLDGGMFEGQGAPGHGRAARRIVGEPRTRSFGAARRALGVRA